MIKITCAEADALRATLKALASCTDLSGLQHSGRPLIETIWGTADGQPVLRDVRHPGRNPSWWPGQVIPDRAPCEHFQFDPAPATPTHP